MQRMVFSRGCEGMVLLENIWKMASQVVSGGFWHKKVSFQKDKIKEGHFEDN